MNFLFILFLSGCFTFFAQGQQSYSAEIEDQIGAFIKSTIEKISDEDAFKKVQDRYKDFGLLSDDEKWSHPYLEKVKDALLPRETNRSCYIEIVDKMVLAAKKNPYLHDSLEALKDKDLSTLQEKIKKEADGVLPDVISYSIALNTMTTLMRNDLVFFKSCYDDFEKRKQDLNCSGYGAIKYFSVALAMNNINVSFMTGFLSPCFAKYLLPFNIMQAVFVDYFSFKNSNNAYAGWVLAQSALKNNGYHDLKTGAGPSKFSKEYKAVQIHLPFIQNWSNLYATWNIGFVASLNASPYHLVKLLIPQVNDHYFESSEYMHNRTLALYAHMYFFFKKCESDKSFMSINWTHPTLTKTLGKINSESADSYLRLLQRTSFDMLLNKR